MIRDKSFVVKLSLSFKHVKYVNKYNFKHLL